MLNNLNSCLAGRQTYILRLTPCKTAQAVLLVITLLSVVLISGASAVLLSTREIRYARNYIQAEKARWAAEAGVVYAELLLSKDVNKIDALTDIQFTSVKDRIFELKNTSGTAVSAFSLKILDESGKINLNSSLMESAGSIVSFASDLGLALSLPEDEVLTVEEAVQKSSAKVQIRPADYFTVYSSVKNTSMRGSLRRVLGLSRERELLELFMGNGLHYRKAYNLLDFLDSDMSQSMGDVFSLECVLSASGGGYTFDAGKYCANKSSEPTVFTASISGIEDGQYYVFFKGEDEKPVGTIDMDDQGIHEKIFSFSGLSKKIEVQGGSFTFTLYPDSGKESCLKSVELASLKETEKLEHTIIRGIEAVRINEIMVNPSMTVLTDSTQAPGGGWYWSGGAFRCGPLSNAGNWVFDINRTGYYYLRFFGEQAGDFIGRVSVGGIQFNAYHGSWTSEPVYINGSIVVYSENTSVVSDAVFKAIEISQEPDTEYIELVNMADRPIDIGLCYMDVVQEHGSVLGWPATIPQGTVIGPGGFLVLSVDSSDADGPDFLTDNSLCFRSEWGEDSVQLDFGNAIEGNDDIIPDEGAKIILYSPQGEEMDAVEYSSQQTAPFVSIGRGDPLAQEDQDRDGYFDGWYLSTSLIKATPGQSNKNGFLESIDSQTLDIFYKEQSSVSAFDSDTESLENYYGAPTGFAWKRFDDVDIAFLADRITDEVEEISGQEPIQVDPGTSETMIFKDIVPGTYFIKCFLPYDILDPVFITVKSGQTDFSGSYVSEDKKIFIGAVSIKDKEDVSITLVSSEQEQLTVEKIILEPKAQIKGQLNINTSPEEIMYYLFGNKADGIIAHRPYGEFDTRLLGIGDLLLSCALGETAEEKLAIFAKYKNMLSVKSDVYEIVSTGQTGDMYKAVRTVETIVKR